MGDGPTKISNYQAVQVALEYVRRHGQDAVWDGDIESVIRDRLGLEPDAVLDDTAVRFVRALVQDDPVGAAPEDPEEAPAGVQGPDMVTLDVTVRTVAISYGRVRLDRRAFEKSAGMLLSAATGKEVKAWCYAQGIELTDETEGGHEGVTWEDVEILASVKQQGGWQPREGAPGTGEAGAAE